MTTNRDFETLHSKTVYYTLDFGYRTKEKKTVYKVVKNKRGIHYHGPKVKCDHCPLFKFPDAVAADVFVVYQELKYHRITKTFWSDDCESYHVR